MKQAVIDADRPSRRRRYFVVVLAVLVITLAERVQRGDGDGSAARSRPAAAGRSGHGGRILACGDRSHVERCFV